MRKTILLLALLAGASVARAQTAAAPPAATQPAAESAVMARVNGKVIPMTELTDLLIRGYGLPLAEHLIANELVRQAAAEKGIKVTPAEVEAEHQRTLAKGFGGLEDAKQREQALQQYLEQRGLSRRQWDMTMWRNAALRRLAEGRVQVTDEMLRAEFGNRYGRQVEVSHIQTATLADARAALKLLAEGQDFAAVARKLSLHPSAQNGGKLPAIGAATPVPVPGIREAALALKKVGDVSEPVQAGTTFHILRLDHIIEPKDAKFEDVKDALATELRDRQIQALQQQILMDMIRDAQASGKIEYVNPILKAQAEERSKP
ncbi:MAG TPA: peptidyl-prolyl cis-trans isomerase [Phycisphaerae bacterium]|nr:peptidyl-prolyl cis-trans isomerase [Phycisphaerae bacterium]